jgi:serine/threonine protein kinase
MTPAYRAPEVAYNVARGSFSDVWSLGCTFLEMVTVLKGGSVGDLRAYFEERNECYRFYSNIDAAKDWMVMLKAISDRDNPPLKWVSMMLEKDRKIRPTAGDLVRFTHQASVHDPASGILEKFCGSCCLGGENGSRSGNPIKSSSPYSPFG